VRIQKSVVRRGLLVQSVDTSSSDLGNTFALKVRKFEEVTLLDEAKRLNTA